MKLKNLTVAFGTQVIIDDLSVDFVAGSVHHIVGRNGSGKSTLAKVLTGLIPHKGKVQKDGTAAVIASYSALPSDLSVIDVKRLIRSGDSAELIPQLAIDEISPNKKLGKLSDGQKQKLKLAFYLSFSPKILILDEISNSLDKTSEETIHAFLRGYVEINDVVIVNITHDLHDLYALPGFNYFLQDGNLAGPISVEEVKDLYIGKEHADF